MKLTTITILLIALLFPSQDGQKPPKPTTTTTTTLVSPVQQKAWNKVAWCETHGDWDMRGATFSGGLGISNVVWLEYGGMEFAPHAGLATPQEQMVVANRINKGYVPDQHGCNGGW